MSLPSNPLVSICIPVYNDAVFVRYLIDSVIAQTYQNWELIITNDCSTDNTLEVLRSYTDPRIIVIENEKNLGLSRNWNAVVKHAKGEYVKLIPSDDVISPDCIEKQLEIFLSGKYPSVAMVSCYRNIIDSKGNLILKRAFPFKKKGLIPSKLAISLNFLFGGNQIGEPGVTLFKRSAFSEVGIFDVDNNYMIDIDFWVRVLLTGDLYVVPEFLASFRIQNERESCTGSSYKQHAKLFRQFAKKYYDDKRFHISSLQYYISYVNSYLFQTVKKYAVKIYFK